MEDNSEDFEKIFNEMIQSEDLKAVSEKVTSPISAKDLHLTTQILLESLEHISSALANEEQQKDFGHLNDPKVKSIFLSLTKLADDFNDSIVDLIIESDIIDSEIDDFLEDFEEDDEN